jgi:protein-disulfide isomerase
MHDWLYANQSSVEAASAFTKSRLSDIGKAAGLDMSSFQPCLDQGTHNAAIAAEQTARPADATVTPSVYVNGKLVSGGSYADIKAALDAALG